jgi:diamine N-acetyltransferase
MRNELQKEKVTLRIITSKTVRTICGLNVGENQCKLVTANAVSLAEASFYKNAWFRAIYAGQIPVGFIMLYQIPTRGYYYLWRFMIDAKHQGKGYGTKALEKVITKIKKNPKAKAVKLSLVKMEGCAEPFYRKFGFEFTGEIKHEQHIMKLFLR